MSDDRVYNLPEAQESIATVADSINRWRDPETYNFGGQIFFWICPGYYFTGGEKKTKALHATYVGSNADDVSHTKPLAPTAPTAPIRKSRKKDLPLALVHSLLIWNSVSLLS